MSDSKNIVGTLLKDIVNGTSHSVEYLTSNIVEDTVSESGIRNRKAISPILCKLYKTKTEYKIIIDHREELPKNKNGNIFLVNHRQADDIVIAANVINENGYILFGNPDLILETSNGLGLWANGVILVIRENELSRKSSIDKMRYVLSHGGNVIIWYEGYWNLDDNGEKDFIILPDGTKKIVHEADDHNSESWLIQEPNIGPFKLAQELGSNIVPLLLHYDETNGKKCYGSRLAPLNIKPYEDVIAKKNEFVEISQTELYRLMEKYSTYNRSELEKSGKTLLEQWQELKEELIRACDIPRIGYKLDLANEKLIGKCKYVQRPVTTNTEVFEYIPDIIYKDKDGRPYRLTNYVPGIKRKSI